MFLERLRNLILGPALALLGSGCAAMASDEATIACQAADVATTIVALKKGATEANPIMAAVLDATGLPGLVLVKIAFTWFVLKYLKPEPEGEKPRPVETARAMVNGITCAVAVHNVGVIRRLP